jgi:hypothetical protein
MKNGYTPREYAYSIAIDALHAALRNREDVMEGFTRQEMQDSIMQINKLMLSLADKVKMDVTPVNLED